MKIRVTEFLPIRLVQITSIRVLIASLGAFGWDYAKTEDLSFVDFDKSMEFRVSLHDEVNYVRKQKRQPLDVAREDMLFLKNLYEKNHFSRIAPKQDPIIPKIIHQIWVGPKTPPSIFKESQESIKRYHPDWEYRLWTDADLADFKLENQKFYDESKNYGEKADILRYEVLHRYGGVYLDVDFVCVKPFDILNHSYEFYTSLLPLDCDDTICNAVIGSIPGHEVLRECIESMKDGWLAYKHLSPLIQVILRAGPFHFQKSFLTIARKYNGGPIIAFPKSYFFPVNYGVVIKNKGKQPEITKEMLNELLQPEAFAAHFWAHSWR
jgi:mannosyltransferase OCH1-like enzyme